MKNNSDGFKKSNFDEEIEAQIVRHCATYEINALDAVKLFPVLARRQWIKRFLAHSDFFRKTLDVPGDIAELGVFRGLGMMTWANLLETFCIGDRTKIVYGFDNWQGFKGLTEQDGRADAAIDKIAGGFSPKHFYGELESAISIFDDDRFISKKPRVKLINGDIERTVPDFLSEHPGIRFSLVHFDCDLYQPTRIALEHIWPRVSRGGIILFDEYAIKDWPGETAAVDEFFGDKPGIPILTLPWNNVPGGYVVKP